MAKLKKLIFKNAATHAVKLAAVSKSYFSDQINQSKKYF